MQVRGILLLTFRELWSNKIVLALLLVSTLAWLMVAFAINLDIVEGTLVGLRIFGRSASPAEMVRDPETGERVQQLLSLEQFVVRIEAFVAGLAYWVGTLLALFATAPLLSGMLERGRIDLLLSRPVRRVPLLAGHILAVWLTMILLAIYLLGMVWLVISLKSGLWHVHFFIVITLVVAMFVVMYSAVVVIVVFTESTSVALITTYGLIFTSVILATKEHLAPQINPPWRQVFLTFYHILPKFAEVTGIVAKLTILEPVDSWYPVYSSLGFGAVLYIAAVMWFVYRDF